MITRYIQISLALCTFAISGQIAAQEEGLPHQLTRTEIENAVRDGYVRPADRNITTPPNFTNMRTMAEWEEIQALTISWIQFPAILKQIAAAARLECEVIILSENPASTQSYLLAANAGGPAFTNLNNITILQSDLNSIWMRDYAGNTVYGNEVDDLFLTDWIYNRPRFDDDVTPDIVGATLGIDVYNTTNAPTDMMNTGGNFMSDGFGMAFCSELVLEENDGATLSWITKPDHTEAEVDQILTDFMGISQYVKMTQLPYDGINHIDMHMKLLDEETILVSRYPEGVADGPQIEQNINYVLNNFTTKWGTPFKIIDIPAPPQSNGQFPDAGGDYLTYSNAIFVNKTILVPTYYGSYDTDALAIWEAAMPGYTIVGIDCDDPGNNIIALSGAIHCITHSVGVSDPLLISYKSIENTNNASNPYPLTAYIKHRSGIASANLYYKTSLGGAYTSVAMTNAGAGNWTSAIPAQPLGSTVYYYVSATSNSGKTQVRPIVAPDGYKSFRVVNEVFGCTSPTACNFDPGATLDNGTCIEPDGCTNPAACNYNPDAQCDDGTCQIGSSNTLVVSTDCWGNETSWLITDANNNTLFSSNAGAYGNQTTYTTDFCLGDGCYTFTINDSFGDGLNGSASSGCSVDGDFSITAADGTVLVQMASANFGNSASFEFCVSNPIPGCTDATACNFDPAAEEDDGSCEFASCACPLDLNNDEQINTQDLLIVVSDLGCDNACVADVNGDEQTNTQDLLLMVGALGTSCQ